MEGSVYAIACVQPLLHLIQNRFVGREGAAVHGLYEVQSDGNCTLGEGRGVLKTAVYTMPYFGQACYSPYPLSGGSFCLKENAQIKTLFQTFLKS